MAPPQPLDVLFYLCAVGVFFLSAKFAVARSRGIQTTPLRGPTSKSILFGMYRYLNLSEDSAAIYEQWANEYGPVYKVPGGFGSHKIMIVDQKANAHFYSKETFGYVQTKLSRVFIENLVSKPGYLCLHRTLIFRDKFGRGLLWAEGESHRRCVATTSLTHRFVRPTLRSDNVKHYLRHSVMPPFDGLHLCSMIAHTRFESVPARLAPC
jgi:hypothetical protein